MGGSFRLLQRRGRYFRVQRGFASLRCGSETWVGGEIATRLAPVGARG